MNVGKLSQRKRAMALFANLAIAWAVHRCVSGRWSITGDTSDAWFIGIAAFWILGLISSPYFRPPKDSLANGLGSLIALVTISVSTASQAYVLLLSVKIIGLALSVTVIALAVLAIAASTTHRESKVSRGAYRFSNELGRGEYLFTSVVLVSVFGAYGDNLPALLSIVSLWILAISIGISEFVFEITRALNAETEKGDAESYLGKVERFDSPGLVRVLLSGRAPWDREGVCVLELSDRKQVTALPLFEHPAVEGRIGTAVVASAVLSYVPKIRELEVHSYAGSELRASLMRELSGIGAEADLAGIVIEGSSIAALRFEAISESLHKGQIVVVRSNEKIVYYQITEAFTGEESLSSQLHGRRIATAIQLGEFDSKRGFIRYDWVPQMNSCVFRVPEDFELKFSPGVDQYNFGVLPGTTCGVYVDVDEIVHYHAAVLGVTGTGKTELSLDLIRASIDRGCKVVCVDFTGEYASRLADLQPLQLGLTVDLGARYEEAIFAVETGAYGAPAEKAALKRFVDEIKPLIEGQVNSFLAGDQMIAVLELAEITNTKATLRTTELFLSAFMSWAKRNRKAKKILLVLEEAHTIVPETGGSGMDYDSKWVVDRIGQIALQGRKYGVGLLVVSQRTALVSKTILSQCNTFFTFCLVDQTSLNFLASVLSTEHVAGISNLQRLELVAYGRAVSSERPLLVRRAYDEAKATASAQLDIAAVIPVVDPGELSERADLQLMEWLKQSWPNWKEEESSTPDEFDGTSNCPVCQLDFLVFQIDPGPYCFYCEAVVEAEKCADCGTTNLKLDGCGYCKTHE